MKVNAGLLKTVVDHRCIYRSGGIFVINTGIRILHSTLQSTGTAVREELWHTRVGLLACRHSLIKVFWH